MNDDYVEGHDAVGKAWHIPIVMLNDPGVRGRLHLPLIDDDARAKLSGRRERRLRIETRDWFVVAFMFVSTTAQVIAALHR